jgi:hypothetical protein
MLFLPILQAPLEILAEQMLSHYGEPSYTTGHKAAVSAILLLTGQESNCPQAKANYR